MQYSGAHHVGGGGWGGGDGRVRVAVTSVVKVYKEAGDGAFFLDLDEVQPKRSPTEVLDISAVTFAGAAAKLLPGLGITVGFAIDLCQLDEEGGPWDFDLAEKRPKALDLVLKDKPMMLVGSPMCTAFCAWQKLNEDKRDPERVKAESQKTMLHLRFVCKLYAVQAAAGL